MSHPRDGEHAPPPPPPPPHRDPALVLLVAGLVPIAVSAAAAATSIWGTDPVVSRTAWIVLAVVGTATMVSAAACVRPRKFREHAPPGKDQKPPQDS